MGTTARGPAATRAVSIVRWLDSWTGADAVSGDEFRVDWARIAPLIALHIACLGVVWVGASPIAVGTAGALYVIRMLSITGAYHRYFSHRAYKTSRIFQFLLAVAGASAVQRGPLWWAAHHRLHHRRSDRADDVHSPVHHGFLWSHIGWLTSRSNFVTDVGVVGDLARFPELRFLDRFDTLVPMTLGTTMFVFGAVLNALAPGLGTNGAQMFVWGFCISSVVLLHATCSINSLGHLFGRRRYETGDNSGNALLLAVLTLGEGWHNNHHHYPRAARQGFYWWEIDITYYVLRLLSRVGLVWHLTPLPAGIRESNRRRR